MTAQPASAGEDPTQVPFPECEQLLNRLRRADGQLRAVITMLENQRSCSDVATQMAAAKSAVDKAAMLMVLKLAGTSSDLEAEDVTKLALPLA